MKILLGIIAAIGVTASVASVAYLCGLATGTVSGLALGDLDDLFDKIEERSNGMLRIEFSDNNTGNRNEW